MIIFKLKLTLYANTIDISYFLCFKQWRKDEEEKMLSDRKRESLLRVKISLWKSCVCVCV